MSKKKEQYDDKVIAQIDKDMGWVEKDGSCPSKTASDLGCHCKFLDGPFSATAWVGEDRVWSVCSLVGIRTTLLARSFAELERLYRKMQERKEKDGPEKWQQYYKNMWKRRYLKWVCSGNDSCNCQLCRIRNDKKDS